MERIKINQSINRNSSIELLRVLAMIMIIFHHMFVHGYYRNDLLKDNDVAWFWINSFSWLGMIGNYIFMLITGYFTHYETVQRTKSVAIKIYIKLFLYSVIIGIIFLILKLPCVPNNSLLKADYHNNGFISTAHIFNVKDFINCFFPFLRNVNWFASSYLIFLFFIPYINKMIQTITDREHFILCLIVIFIGSVLQSIPGQLAFSPSSIFQFFMMFFIGAYLRRKGIDNIRGKSVWGVISLSILFILLLGQVFIVNLGIKFNLTSDLIQKTSRRLSISFLSLICSVCIFIFFLKLKSFDNKIINKIGKSTFGVYLIHDNAIFSIFMWNRIFHINESNSIFPLQNLFIPFVIFIIASIFDMCFDYIYEMIVLGKKR